MLARLGAAEMTGKELVATLYPELLREAALPRAADKTAPVVIGLDSGQVARPAPCCNPIPGERIVGIAVRGKGVMIHAIDCAELGAFEDEPDRWIDLRWAEGQAQPDHVARVEVTLANDAGVLGRICTLIGEQRANITDIVFTDRKPDFFRMVIDIEVRDMEHLTHVLTAIDADSDVAQVRRFRQAPATGEGGGPRLSGARRVLRAAARWIGTMVFKRRDKPPFLSRIRESLLPRRGWRRGIEYLGHRVRRLPDTPHRIALGFACGVFASFTPFFGLHLILAVGARARPARQHGGGADRDRRRQSADLSADRLGLARRSGGASSATASRGRDFSRVSDAFAEAFAGDLATASSASSAAATASGRSSSPFFRDIIWPYLVGGLLPGLVAAIVGYYLMRPLVAAYQARRRARMLARAHDRLAGGAGREADAPRGRAYKPRTPDQPRARPDHDATTPLGRLRLGVNIDHVATVRNARGGPYPDPLRAAKLAEAAGADGITAHLREDRRHITDADIDGADGGADACR